MALLSSFSKEISLLRDALDKLSQETAEAIESKAENIIVAKKADKSELERLLRIMEENLKPGPNASGDFAVLAGKPLLGWKCMSCDRPLLKLSDKLVQRLSFASTVH